MTADAMARYLDGVREGDTFITDYDRYYVIEVTVTHMHYSRLPQPIKERDKYAAMWRTVRLWLEADARRYIFTEEL